MIRFYEHESEIIEVAKIHVDNQKATYVGILEQTYLDSLTYEHELANWRKWVKRSDRELLLYMENGAVLGFAGVRFYEREVGSGMLSYLHVRSDMQHKGIGRALIAASAGLLYNMGIPSMYIDVIDGNNRAESLYSSLGAVACENLNKDLHKRYRWKDVNVIADTSIAPRKKYVYENLIESLQGEFVLFGAGEYCDVFMKQFPKNIPVKIFDNDVKKHGTYKNGCCIEAPQTVENVIVASCYYDEIEQQLDGLNCQNVIPYYPWHNYCEGTLE